MAYIVELLNKVTQHLTVGEIFFLIIAIVFVLLLKARFVRQLSKIKTEFVKAADEIRASFARIQEDAKTDFAQMSTSVQGGLRQLRSEFEGDFNEMQSRLSHTSDHVKDIIANLDGRTEYLQAALANLEKRLERAGLTNGHNEQIASVDNWNAIKGGIDELKLFLRTRAGAISDGRRRKKYEARDWRSLLGIIDDLEYDKALSQQEAELAREMHRIFVITRFRPNDIGVEELTKFKNVKQEIISGARA
jgi:hypothetical protein